VASIKFGTGTPEAETIILLCLLADRVFDNANAPFFLEIWSFANDLILEILGEKVFSHVIKGITVTAMFISCRLTPELSRAEKRLRLE
jgi:hypothetical protein